MIATSKALISTPPVTYRRMVVVSFNSTSLAAGVTDSVVELCARTGRAAERDSHADRRSVKSHLLNFIECLRAMEYR